MRLVYRLCLSVLLGGGLVACGAAPEATVPMPAATAAVPVAFRQIALDKFDNDALGWDQFIEPGKGESGYDENRYRIKVLATDTHIWANPNNLQPMSDVHIQVDAHKDDGDNNNLYGVICRYVNEKNFYFFVISSDGHFGIGKVVDGQYQLLNRRDYPPSTAIETAHGMNKIYVECVGQDLRLFVNDELVDEQTDSDYTMGNVGLIAATFSGETVIVFDNFEVRGP